MFAVFESPFISLKIGKLVPPPQEAADHTFSPFLGSTGRAGSHISLSLAPTSFFKEGNLGWGDSPVGKVFTAQT